MLVQEFSRLEHIYSRPRFNFSKIPYNGRPRKKNHNNPKYNKLFKSVLIILIGILAAKRLIDILNPIINSQCASQARNIAIEIMNKQSAIVMEDYKYEDLVTIVKDSNGKIQLIKLNIVPINEIVSSVTLRIQEDLNNTNYADISVALGSLSGIKVLSGIGPKMHIKISCEGNVDTKINSTFKSAGINQTVHQVYLEVSCNINIFTPYDNVSQKIDNQILIAESVILGDIPNSIYNPGGS